MAVIKFWLCIFSCQLLKSIVHITIAITCLLWYVAVCLSYLLCASMGKLTRGREKEIHIYLHFYNIPFTHHLNGVTALSLITHNLFFWHSWLIISNAKSILPLLHSDIFLFLPLSSCFLWKNCMRERWVRCWCRRLVGISSALERSKLQKWRLSNNVR